MLVILVIWTQNLCNIEQAQVRPYQVLIQIPAWWLQATWVIVASNSQDDPTDHLPLDNLHTYP